MIVKIPEANYHIKKTGLFWLMVLDVQGGEATSHDVFLLVVSKGWEQEVHVSSLSNPLLMVTRSQSWGSAV